MHEIPTHMLTPVLRRHVEDARLALDRGDDSHAARLCMGVLMDEPGCMAARKLLRASQLKRLRRGSRMRARARGFCAMLMHWPLAVLHLRRNPHAALLFAEKILERDPLSLPAHRLLARGAAGAGFPGTAAFAWQCACEVRPGDRRLQLELANACLQAGRLEDALRVTDALLRVRPCDARARELMTRASFAQFARNSAAAAPVDTASGLR